MKSQKTLNHNACFTTAKLAHEPRKAAKLIHRQRGFTLVEIAIVLAIIIIAAVIGLPQINAYIIENKVTPVGKELQRFVARSKASGQGAGSTPYAGMGQAQLANGLRGSSVVTIQGAGANSVVLHGIGATGGNITVAPADLGAFGDSFTITLNQVNEAACPALASVMHRVSEAISINGVSVKAVAAGGAQGAYLPQIAEQSCVAGDTNVFVFHAR